MLILNKRRKGILRLETVYFCGEHENYKTDADIVLFYLSPENTPGARVFHTLRVDLIKSEEEILGSFHETTRKQIRRVAAKGEVSIDFYSSLDEALLKTFCENYDEFAGTKGIPTSDINLLRMAGESGALSIALLRDQTGEILCGTASIHDRNIVLGMYSFSHFRRYAESADRSRVSQANRYLYWEMMQHYKQKGFAILDMGGLGMGQETPDLDTVDQFKMGFGGKIQTLYHFYHGRTLLGRIALKLLNKNKNIEY